MPCGPAYLLDTRDALRRTWVTHAVIAPARPDKPSWTDIKDGGYGSIVYGVFPSEGLKYYTVEDYLQYQHLLVRRK